VHTTPSSTSSSPSEFFSAMSSLGGSAARGEGVPERRGPSRLKGSRKKTETPVAMPPMSQKRGCPKGSRNQKTLAALAAVAAAAPTTIAAAGASLALGGEGVPGRRGPGRPRGSGKKTAPTAAAAPSSPRRCGRPPATRIRKPWLPSVLLPLAPRGPARRPLLRLVRLGSDR
jgi:hypothetical protein